MKIDVHQIPPEGVTVAENIDSRELDVGSDVATLSDPVRVEALVYRVTNALSARVSITAVLHAVCSRCLDGFVIKIDKSIDLNYPLDKTIKTIDLNPDIREELILELPVQPLCRQECRGLCQQCGKNKNEGGCTCGST
jgi:uncharacterized protein